MCVMKVAGGKWGGVGEVIILASGWGGWKKYMVRLGVGGGDLKKNC